MEWPPEFIAAHSAFLELCHKVDDEFEHLLSGRPGDIILDDKVCAYLLSDYQDWGGHLREWDGFHEEIHAETTRLFMRARTFQASRHLCEAALARHSPRRVIGEPNLSFATADFPRGDRFRSEWQARLHSLNSLEMFAQGPRHQELQVAVAARRAHIRGLFDVLPLHVNRALGEATPGNSDAMTQAALGDLPHRDRHILHARPGVFLEDVFGPIGEWIAEDVKLSP
jgi:hypothetical protein